jgi:hypothetical protein
MLKVVPELKQDTLVTRLEGGRGRPALLQEVGTVTAAEELVFTVSAVTGEHAARRAVSCLVAPEVGDEVLLVAEEGRAWILAVLERREGAPVALEAGGDLAVRLRHGRFSVAAQEGIDLSTAQEASIASGTLRVTAAEAGIQLDRLSYLGRLVHAEVERVKVFAGSVDSVLDRFWQKVKRSYRFVEESDHVRAEQIDYAAEKNAQLRGRNALVTAEQLVKIDGEQIHVG